MCVAPPTLRDLIHIVKVSGGKDSAATLIRLAEEGIEPRYAVFNFVKGNMPEESKDHIRELVDVAGEELGIRPELVIIESEDFLKMMREKHKPFPTPKTLWCMYWLKIVPFRRWLNSLGIPEPRLCVDIGVKASDSWRRKRLYGRRLYRARELRTTFKGVGLDAGYYWVYLPILDMSDKEVVRLISRYPRIRGVVFRGYERLGNPSTCYVCPYHSRKLYMRMPRESLIKALKILREIEGMEHIGRFKLGLKFLERQRKLILEALNEGLERFM